MTDSTVLGQVGVLKGCLRPFGIPVPESVLVYAEHLLSVRDFGGFLMLFPPEGGRLKGFLAIEDELSDEDYWHYLGDTWIISETNFQNRTIWQRLLQSPRRKREHLMGEEDRMSLDALPDDLTIFRGHIKGNGAAGMSWTLDKSKAEWFASSYACSFRRGFFSGVSPGVGSVVSGRCLKQDVIAYFQGREESEILIFPDKVYAKKHYLPGPVQPGPVQQSSAERGQS